MTTRSGQILGFLSSLSLPDKLPNGVEAMNPYQDPDAWQLCVQFYDKYYADLLPRRLMLGINPGRFGGGVTGIPFTDPVKLEQDCCIPNSLKKKTELSADFIYKMIHSFGGPEKFYQQYYISAVSPLGFIRNGKNVNYYDDPALEKMLMPFMIKSMQTQLGFALRRDACFCLGEGKNFKFLSDLNDEYHFFEKIVPLAHPRFVMQYKRKKLNEYIADYHKKLTSQK